LIILYIITLIKMNSFQVTEHANEAYFVSKPKVEKMREYNVSSLIAIYHYVHNNRRNMHTKMGQKVKRMALKRRKR
jgi:hypothetical protein